MSDGGYQAPPHRGPLESWPEVECDAALHLLDRQIVAVDGKLVGKVDDLELTVDPDGSLVPTGLMVGAAALLPRIGNRFGDWLAARHRQIGVARADRSTPYMVDMELVDEVTSEVHLSEPREGVLRRRAPAPDGPTRHRLGNLMEMEVRMPPGSTGRSKAHVLDVRIAPDDGVQRVAALVVGPGRPGSLLGYDRRQDQGPWIVATVVRRLHRHARVVELGPDVEVDWATCEIRVGPGATIRPVRE